MAITTTAGDIIARALRLIGVLGEDETPSAAMSTNALQTLNEWIDAQQLSSLMAIVNERTVYSLVADQSTYTIGPATLTPDWSTGTKPRPTQLSGAGLVLNTASPAVEVPLAFLTDDEYEAIGIKTYSNPQPTSIYYNPTMPTGTGFLWPTPTTALNEIAIYTLLATAQFSDLSTSVTLPPGYARAFRSNLALELCSEWGRPIPPDLPLKAAQALSDVKQANVKMADLSVDRALWPRHHGIYNIWSDQG